jgi:DNA-directed RNA polymerase II subunit RPB2
MLPEIILEHSPVNVYCPKQRTLHRIFLSNICIKKPTIQEANGFIRELFPIEAHLRKQTYCFDVFLDVQHKVYYCQELVYRLKEDKIYQNVLFCKIPCMLNTSTCHTYKDFDHPQRNSGTFIINGYEKVIITQEKLRCNFPYVFPIKQKNKYTYRCEVRSFHSSKIRSTSTLNIYISAEKTTTVPEITVVVPFIKHYIPLPVIFRLLGVCDLKSMLYYIIDTAPNCSQKLLYRAQSILCTDTSNTFNMTSDELYDWIGLKGSTEKQHQKRIQYVKHVFMNEFFPHCGGDYSTPEKAAFTNAEKAFYLGYCVRKLLMVSLDEIPPDDIDHYANKRCCATGLQFALLLRQLIRNFIKMLHVQVFKAVTNSKYINVIDFFNHRKISAGIKYACATGNWGIQKGMTNQSGVCQVINTMNLPARLSHLRLINTPLNRDGKLPRPRQLHRSHLGILCAAETPEGKSVGLLNQMAFLTRLRVGCPSRFLIDLLTCDMGVVPLPGRQNLTLVLVNGIICGGVQDPLQLVRIYKEYRRTFSVPVDSSITYRETHKEVSILTDAEDAYRPLLRADKIAELSGVFRLYGEYLHLFWSQLLIAGVVEYINKEEESDLFVCMLLEDLTPQHTHLELHPSFTLYGVCAGLIPFSEHNQAPRNIYQSAMGKQAISGQPLGFAHQMDTKTHVLDHPQRALVTSWTSELVGFDKDPAGQSCVVAILIYGGFNQEDSVYLNQSALDRGLFRSTFYRVVKETEATHGSDIERFDPEHHTMLGKRKGDYTKLDDTGIMPIGTVVNKDDILIGKSIEYTMVNKENSGEYLSQRIKRDRSVASKHEEVSKVHSVVFSDTKEGLKYVSVKTASTRIPEIGDKFSSRHGQKGICGMTLPHADMPYTADGVVPDLIVNCHAIPSRMTVAQLLEMHLGKVSCLEGQIADGTAFRKITAEEINEHSLDQFGKEIMYNGKTGEMLQQKVFIGVAYYQRLRHIVRDKLHARAKGPNQILTRQPVEGRSRKGGFRMGEMERDALICHGASAVIRDRFLDQSDKFRAFVCQTCGFFAEPNAPEKLDIVNILHKTPYCRYCKSNDNIYPVDVPYAFKLLTQELGAVHIGMKFKLDV